jgi:hypothetical protein
VPIQFKGLPWRNRELSLEMLVRFFYEFASENARNAVIELNSRIAQSPGGFGEVQLSMFCKHLLVYISIQKCPFTKICPPCLHIVPASLSTTVADFLFHLKFIILISCYIGDCYIDMEFSRTFYKYSIYI